MLMRTFNRPFLAKRLSAVACIPLLMGLATTPASALTLELETQTQPPAANPAAPEPAFQLPALDQVLRTPAAYGSTGARFRVAEVVVGRTKLLTKAEIARYTAPFINAEVTLADINALRDELTDAVVAKGYINSGAVIDATNLRDGVLSITIVEGRLRRIKVNLCDKTGHCRARGGYLKPDYISQRLAAGGTDQPLKADQLQQAFQLLLEDHNLSHLNARLVPGAAPGDAELDVDASEEPRQSVTAVIASDRSPAVGDTRAGIGGNFAPELIAGDQVTSQIGRTEGLTDGALSYKAPLTANNLDLLLYAQGSSAKILSRPLNALDAVSRSVYFGGGLSYPLIALPGRSLVLSSNIDLMHVETSLLNQAYSFSPGAVNGVTQYVASRTNLTYTYFSNVSSYVLNLGITGGLHGDRNATGVDTHFVYADLSGSFITRLNNLNHRLILKADARLTGSRLYATESFVIGGSESVRGYRQNALIGDSGYWASVEYQIPLVSVLPPMDTINPMFSSQSVTLGGFFDAGHVTGAINIPGAGHDLAAIGLHTIWTPTTHFDLDMYLAHQMDPTPYSGSYQDSGFGFAAHMKY